MRSILYSFMGLCLFAHVSGAATPTVGDAISPHTTEDTTGFAPRPDNEVEKARSQLRQEILRRFCQLSFWVGQDQAHSNCDISILAQKHDGMQSTDQLLKNILAYKGIDFTQRGAANQFLKGTASFFQSYLAYIEQTESLSALKLSREKFLDGFYQITDIAADKIPQDARALIKEERESQPHMSDAEKDEASKQTHFRSATELNAAKDAIRTHMAEHFCQISMWVGHDLGYTKCKLAIVPEENREKPDPNAIMDRLDELMKSPETKLDSKNKEILVELTKLQGAYMAALEQATNIKAVDVLNRMYHDKIFEIMDKLEEAVPKEARDQIAAQKGQFPSMKGKIGGASTPSATPAPAPSPAPAATPAPTATPGPERKVSPDQKSRWDSIYDG